MKSDKKIFDDISRMAGGAVNIMSGLQQQVRDEIRSRFDEFAGRLDLIPRSEFEDLQATVKALAAKVSALEKGKSSPAKSTTKSKPAAKSKPKAKKKS